MTTEQALREALQAVIAAHEAGMQELGERMRAANQKTLTVRGQAAIAAFDAIEKARAALALPTAAPVDEREKFEAEMRGKHGWNGSYFTQSNDGGYLSNRATYAYIGWQARAALQSSADVRDAVLAEREACAKVCDSQIERWTDDRARYCASECAAAIRARSEGGV